MIDNTYEYMVATRCNTFNHEHFIEKALEGFSNQETSFPFINIIVDDASRDGTARAIIKFVNNNFDLNSKTSYEKDEDYGHVVFSQHKQNKNCFFAVVLLKENHYGKKSKLPYILKWLNSAKYQALCEGDDYWISSIKLQNQVDFLEKNPNHVLTCHRYKIYDFENKKWFTDGHDDLFLNSPQGIDFDYSVNRNIWLTKTLSLVYRTDDFKEYTDYIEGLDKEIVYLLMKQGPGYCFNQEWGVYRLSHSGIHGKQTLLTNRMRTYNSIKRLYEKEPSPILREEYYDYYSTVLFLSKGRILFNEKFEFIKFMYALILAIKKGMRYVRNRKKGGYNIQGVK